MPTVIRARSPSKKIFAGKKSIDWFRAGIEILTLRGFARFQKASKTWDETDEKMLELEWQSSWELEEKKRCYRNVGVSKLHDLIRLFERICGRGHR